MWQGEGWVPAITPSSTGEIADSTGGLNRDGNIVLLVATEHEPLTLGGSRPTGCAPACCRPSPASRRTVRRRRSGGSRADAIGGTVTAEHSELVASEVLGKSDGKPDQVFRSGRTPVLPRDGQRDARGRAG